MKRLSTWIDENRKKVWFSVGLNLLILAVMLLFMVPNFESNDDITMSEIVNGALGVHDAHIIFQHYFLGLLYKGLYSITAGVTWYSVVQYVFLLISFCVITYVLLQKMDHYSGLCVTLVLLIFFEFECYFRLQFTKTAGAAGSASVLFLLYALDREKISWKMILFGELFGMIGSMFRYRQFLACGALMAGIGVFFVLELRQKYRGRCIRRLMLYAGTFGTLIFLVYALHLVDARIYSSDPEWNTYVQFNKSRAKLVDRSFPDYDTYREVYDKIDWNRDAFALFTGLDIYDTEKFTYENMQELIRVKPKQQITGDLIKRFIKNLTPYHFDTPVFYCVLLMFLLWLAWGDHRWRGLLAVLSEFLFFELVYFYMFYDGRYLINRVDAGLWFSVSLVLIWFMRPEKVKLSRRACVLFFLSVLAMNQWSWRTNWRINYGGRLAYRKEQREILETVSSDKEHIYFAKTIHTLTGSGSYGPFDPMPEGLLDNIRWLGGWTTGTPLCGDVLEGYGISNPYRDMIGNEKARLIDDNIGLTMSYIHTYYDENARAVVAGKVGDFDIYQIETGK